MIVVVKKKKNYNYTFTPIEYRLYICFKFLLNKTNNYLITCIILYYNVNSFKMYKTFLFSRKNHVVGIVHQHFFI